ncbi:MAG: class I SAM-dependent methyltransferase [Acidimicrobiales bacterium]
MVIDAHQDRFRDAGWPAVLAAGLEGVCTLLPERSQLALARLVEDGFLAEAAFVDSSHIVHNVFVDLYFLREIVRPGGLVIIDDCNYSSLAARSDTSKSTQDGYSGRSTPRPDCEPSDSRTLDSNPTSRTSNLSRDRTEPAANYSTARGRLAP